jgi:hypothetical protein
MTVKGVVRYIIGVALAILLLSFLCPLIGIPRAQIFPPGFAYANATGRTKGVVTSKRTAPTSNPFHVGEHMSLIDYAFRAPYTPLFLGPQKSEPDHLYTGTVKVANENYEHFQIGQTVPVKYETTYPVISGIDVPEAGRSGASSSGLLSSWIGWTLAFLVLGYVIAPWLERLFLRESY